MASGCKRAVGADSAWNERSEEEPQGPGCQLKEGGGGEMCPGR